MKKIIFFLLLIISFLFSLGQQNNPLNQAGIDFVASFNTVVQDAKEGKIKSLNQETINYYNSVLPSNINLNDTTAIQIYREVNNRLDFETVVNNSNYSNNGKNAIKQIFVTALASQNIDTMRAYLILKCEEISNNTTLYSLKDKEMILTQIAIIYNVAPYSSEVFRDSNDNPIPCSWDSGIMGACVIFAAGIGYIVGDSICGTGCTIGGAIIFGVAAVVAYIVS